MTLEHFFIPLEFIGYRRVRRHKAICVVEPILYHTQIFHTQPFENHAGISSTT